MFIVINKFDNIIWLWWCDYLFEEIMYIDFFLDIRLKIDNYLFNYFYYNRYRNYGNWEL